MSQKHPSLPQLSGDLFLTDSGLETILVFDEGRDLPCFAAFVLLDAEEGRESLRSYYRRHAALAAEHGLGAVFETPTWRASAAWGEQLGYDARRLAEVNRAAFELVAGVRDERAAGAPPLVISGSVGPRADGYRPGLRMSVDEARDYHSAQISTLAAAGVDLVTIMTLNYVEESIGVAQAAVDADVPAVISFTVETDGRLPGGEGLGEAIGAVDEATGGAPAYYMINCAHPTHFDGVLASDAPWIERVGGVRANASKRSHAELDEATELDAGDPAELGRELASIRARLPRVNVLGGCCGTDHRHIDRIARACRAG